MKTLGIIIFSALLIGCTHQKVQREKAFALQARGDALFAGVDVFGVKDALKADPVGTAGAMVGDGVLGAGILSLLKVASDELEGSDKKSSKPNVPQIQADVIQYNTGSGSVSYNNGNTSW